MKGKTMIRIGRDERTMIASPDAIQLLSQHEKKLGDECLERLKALFKTTAQLGENWEANTHRDVAFIVQLGKAREALRKTISESEKVQSLVPRAPHGERYQISSLFLGECWKYLSSDPSRFERLHLVTGTVTADETKVLSRMEHVKLAQQSTAYIRADDADAHLKIVELSEKHGHQLLAVFHSHVSRGAASSHPSGIDTAFQNRLAKLGCPAIGGIFSLDGYVRFFSTWRDFEIEVYGKGVEKIHDEPKQKVFQILGLEKSWA